MMRAPRLLAGTVCAVLILGSVPLSARAGKEGSGGAADPPECTRTFQVIRRGAFGNETLAPPPGAGASRAADGPLLTCLLTFQTGRFDKNGILAGADATLSVSPASFKVAFRISKPSDEPFLYGKALGIGDGFQLTFDWNDPGSPPQNVPPQFRLHVDPAGVCVVMVKSSRFLGRADPSLCSATTSGPTGNSRTWTGTITVNWDTLRDPRWGMNLDQFELFANWFRATKHGQSSVEQIAISTCADTSAPSGCVAPAASQSYVAAIGDIGHEPDLPPHRLGIDAYLPVSRQILAGASFSDDSGAALNTRSTAVKALRGPQAKAYACHSCGSFQTDDASAFGAPFTSAGVLGSDLSAFGVDAPPFTMNSVSFPLDSAYKGVYVPFSSGGRSVTVGVAALNGNTKQSGYARDSVLTFAETILPLVQRVSDSPESSRYLREYDVGFIEANGNRTALAPSAGAFSTIPAPLLHSTNAQLELAYSWMSIGQGQRLASGVPERTDIASLVPQRRYAALLRYGAQDTAGGNVLDVAGSFRWQAAPVELNQQGYVGGSLSAAAGYRVVGPNYNPIDGAFDAHVAQHGAFGQVTYSYTLDRPQPEVTSLTVSEWSFADARPRDRALQMQFKTPFPVKSATAGIFSVQSNDTFGRISISQAGRASGIVVTDAAGGGGLLPNDQYNLQLNYALQKRLSMTAGYTYLDAQGCSTKLVAGPQPCYSYRQPQVVGDIAWTPFPLGGIWASTFVEASVQGSTTMPFETESDRVLQTGRFDYYQTTVGHVVRTGAVGMTLLKSPSGCATLLLSTANRGGDPDQFAKSAPVPGFTNTASLEYVAGGGFPSVLLAYSRIQNDVPSPPSSKVLILRLQLGAPFDSFGRSPHGKCGS